MRPAALRMLLAAAALPMAAVAGPILGQQPQSQGEGDGLGGPGQLAAGPGGVGERKAVEEARRLCGPLWGELSADCFAALEQRYLRRPIDLNRHSADTASADPSLRRQRRWRPRPARDVIVWHDLFANPAGLRQSVEAALADPRCRVFAGQPRFDLRRTCAADAMARLAELQTACSDIRYWDENAEYHVIHGLDDELIGHGWPAEWSLEYKILEGEAAAPAEYWRRRRALEESEVHFRWRLARCRAVPAAAFAWLEQLLPHDFEWQQDQSSHLHTLAMRLGSTWANVYYGGEANSMNALAEFDIALAYLHRATVLGLWRRPPASRALSYLLAAREVDSQRRHPTIDWRGFDEAYGEPEVAAARPCAETILAAGWWPFPERSVEDPLWPWMREVEVVRTALVRQRLDHKGLVRWVHEDGTQKWLDGSWLHTRDPDGTETAVITSRAQLQDRRLPPVRGWQDEDGRRRWVDVYGDEHWIADDGSEHWIEGDGTEWILLPLEPSETEQ